MALTGTFDADFSAFFDAVDMAKSKLRDMAGVAETTADELAQVVDSGAPEQLQHLADATDDVTQANQGASVSVGDMITAYISAEAIIGAVTAAFTALVDVVKESITSASDAEQAQVGLEGALRAQGTAVPSVITAYQDYATALQLTTRYSDDAVVATEKILVQIGGVMPRDMQRALKATTDLAAGLGIDLTSAATMVAKAAEGQTTALQKAGVQIDTTKGQTASFDTVLAAITARFGDQAALMAGTYAGALDQTANAWDNLLESVGRTITQNETVRTALAGINTLLTANTGELNQNANANRLVSEAVIILAKGFSLAVEGIDLFQRTLGAAMKTTDLVGIGLLHLYEGLQKIEIATQTPFSFLGGERGQLAIERIHEAKDALDWASGAIQGFRDHQADADASSQQWSATLQGFRGNLDTLTTQLEATRGQTVAVTTAQADAAGVWDKTTGAISAQTMAAQEHAMAMEGVSKGMFQIDAQATALAKAMDANVMAEVKGRSDAEAAFWKMHDAEEQAMIASSTTAKQTVADVQQIDGAVTALTGTFDAAGTGYANMLSAQQALTQDWINYAYTSPGSVPRGTMGQSFFIDPSTGQVQPRAAGGPVSAGSPYLVGERGPELFVPGAGGTILPTGSGAGGVVVQAGAIVMNYPIVNNPQALDQLARTVGDAILTKLTRAGARL